MAFSHTQSSVFVYIIILLFGKTISVHSSDIGFPKCCDISDMIVQNNSTYNCSENIDKRLYISTAIHNYLNRSQNDKNGNCIDLQKTGEAYSIYNYELEGDKIVSKQKQNVGYTSKCCPFNYVYNSSIHSCIYSDKSRPIPTDKVFFKIGLPHCEIIEDMLLESDKDFTITSDNDLKIETVGQVIPFGDYCTERTVLHKTVVKICRHDYKVCDRKTCLRKCCPDGQSFVQKLRCQSTHVRGVDIKMFESSIHLKRTGDFAVIHGGKCKKMYELQVLGQPFTIDADGVFSTEELVPHTNETQMRYYHFDDDKSYCIEHMQGLGMNRHGVFRCFTDPEVYLQLKFFSTRYAMIISCIFLILTVIFYIVSSEVKTLFGKILITYCVTLFILYSLLIHATYYFETKSQKCIILGFLTTFIHFSVSTWLTVMCFDIYFTFGSTKTFGCFNGHKEIRRYILYSLYGWGISLLLTFIIVLFHFIVILPEPYKINIGITKCAIEAGPGNYADIIFSSTPIALMVICNIYMFAKTIYYCLSVSKEINRINDTNKSLKRDRRRFEVYQSRLFLIMKLACIMGVSFTFEVVSSFVSFKTSKVAENIEIAWDTFNSLQGVFIFVIFICKRRMVKKILRKTGQIRARRPSFSSSSTTTPCRSNLIALRSYGSKLSLSKEIKENGKADVSL